MIRKTNDKKVVKAIALGLATMITAGTMNSAVAYAEELPGNENGNETPAAQSEAQDTIEKIGDASEAVGNISTPVVEEKVESTRDLVAGFEGAIKGISDDLDDAKKAMEGDLGDGSAVTTVEDDLAGVNANKETDTLKEEADSKSGIVDAASKKAEDAIVAATKTNDENSLGTDFNAVEEQASTINGLVSEGQNAIDAAVESINDANTVVVDKQKEFEAATNSTDMQIAQDAMVETVEAATKTYDEQLANYNTIKDELETAQTKYDELYEAYVKAYQEYDEAFGSAKGDYDAAYGEFVVANGDYEDAKEKYNDQAYKYNVALANAKDKLDAAQGALADAQNELSTLKEKVSTAQNDVNKAAAGALAVLNAQEKVSDSSSLNWTDADAFFKAYVTNYYGPELNDYTVKKIVKNADYKEEFNYFAVTCVDKDNNEKVICLNYKMGWDNNSYKGDEINLVVFEQADEAVLAYAAAYASGTTKTERQAYDTYTYTDAEGIKHYVAAKTVDGETVVKDYVAGENGSVVAYEDSNLKTFGNKLFVVTDSGEVEEVVKTGTEDSEDGTTKTVTTIGDNETVEYVLDSNGDIVKQISNDVTTVTYTKKSLNAEAKEYDSEEEFEQAMYAELAEAGYDEEDISDGEAEIVETVTHAVDCTVEVGYVSKFTEEITISASANSGIWGFITSGTFKKEAAVEKIKEKLDEDKYTSGKYAEINGNYVYVLEAGELEYDLPEDESNWYDFIAKNNSISAVQDVTYVSAKKEELNATALKGIFGNNGYKSSDDDDDIITKIKEQYKDAYEIEVTVNRNYKKQVESVTVKYVSLTETIEATGSATGDSLDDAKEAAKENALRQISVENALISDKTSAKYSDDSVTTSYAYNFSFWDKTNTNTENMQVATESTDSTSVDDKISGNANYNKENGNYNKTKDDEKYEEFLKGVKGYKELCEQVDAARATVEAAQENVVGIQDSIKDLKTKLLISETKSINEFEIDKLKNQINELTALEQIELDKLADAKALKEQLESQLKDNAEKIIEKLAEEEAARKAAEEAARKAAEEEAARRAAEEEARRNAANNDSNGSSSNESSSDVASVVIVDVEVPMAAAPVVTTETVTRNNNNANANVNVADADETVAGAGEDDTNGNGDGTVEIGDNETPLAGSVEELEDDGEKKVVIDDNDVALAAKVGEDTKKMNWWWLLLIALLGATGYEMYKKNQEKKAAKANAASDNNEI